MDAAACGIVGPRVARASDMVSGALLCVLAVLKLPLLQGAATPVAAIVAGAVEIVIAGLFLVGWRPGVAAAALVALGATTTGWTVLKMTGVVSTGPCGCFGVHRPSDLLHALVAASLLFIGGWHSYLLSVRRWRPRVSESVS